MTIERDNPLLDACLDEVLGGHAPPNLTEQILKALASNRVVPTIDNAEPRPIPAISTPLAADCGVSGVTPALLRAEAPDPATANMQLDIPGCSRLPSNRRRAKQANWLSLALTAAVLLVVSGLGFVGLRYRTTRSLAHGEHEIDGRAIAKTIAKPASRSVPEVDVLPAELPNSIQPESSQLVHDHQPVALPDLAPANPLAPEQASTVELAQLSPPATPALPRAYHKPSPDEEIIAFVNVELAQSWQVANIKPAPLAGDVEWCERLFVRLLGRKPTADELKAFQNDKSATRREKLVDRVLTDSKYAAEFARHWAVEWAEILLGHRNVPATTATARAELEKYLQGAFAANKPFTQIVEELLTATGSNQPDADDYNPAVNFLLTGLGGNTTTATARIGRVFLGRQLRCAQCHDDAAQGLTQEQFWSMNAFLAQTKVQRSEQHVRLINAPPTDSGLRSKNELFYETPAGLVKTALPRFIDGTEIALADLATIDRRQELARLIIQSDDLSRAIVNRVWAHVYGYGFTRPVDGIGPNAKPSQPEVLDRLSSEFAAHDFDLKRLLRWCVLSNSFRRSTKLVDLASIDMPEQGEAALFSRFYDRTGSAPNVIVALTQVRKIRQSAASPSEVEKARIDWLAQANRGIQKGKKTRDLVAGSVIELGTAGLPRSTGKQQSEFVTKIAASSMSFDKKVEHLFLRAVSRLPSRREFEGANEALASNRGNKAAALEDIWWSLLNSNECTLNQ